MAIDADIAQLSDYLVTGYWADFGEAPHHWAAGPITVDITGLTAPAQAIATQAFALWSDVANLEFQFGTGGAVVLSDPATGPDAFGGYTAVDYDPVTGISSAAIVVIGQLYTFVDRLETYIHEIGHVLGLGHLGPYNGVWDNSIFTNDTVQYSVMSYGRQNSLGHQATNMPVQSPAMADIHAVQSIYGANTTTRAGDTVYGFGSNAGAPYDFSANAQPNFTLYDAGGHDLLDASGFAKSAKIDLTPGAWSSIGGPKLNIGIYLDTVIEDAASGDKADTLIGNHVANMLAGNGGNDKLYGGGGDDLLYGGDGVDRLVGGEGADTLAGGTGSDVYVFDALEDTIVEAAGEGKDLVEASISFMLGAEVEKLTLTGLGAIDGTGNALANNIRGNDAANVLNGGAGKDNLWGLGGADSFLFDVIESSTKADSIKDFEQGLDHILLSMSVFTALAPFGAGILDTADLTYGVQATAIDQHLIFNPSQNALYYDADGVGGTAQVKIVTIAGNIDLIASDIVLI